MLSSKRPPHILHKRRRSGKDRARHSSIDGIVLEDTVHGPQSQDRQVRDGLDNNSSGASTTTGSDARLELQDTPTMKNRFQLTSTEYALQEIRSRVRAIDERWEDVNVRAIDTLDKIEENELDRRDPGRKEKWPGIATFRRQNDVRKFSLRGNSARAVGGIDLSRGSARLLEESKAAAWLINIEEIGRAVTRDERLAVALAQSHESLDAASVKFEETQERNKRLLDGLRGWMDGFTGTARPEDTNSIATMLPEPGLENEVANLMVQCKDAASMLEQTTKQHTAQLGEIFCQAGKMYGAEIDRLQRKGMEATGVAQGKIASLEEHANKVETLLKSMEDERATLQSHFRGTEQRCRAVEGRYRKDKDILEEALDNYRHKVIQLERVVTGFEEKARKQEQLGRDPSLGPVLETLSPAALPNTFSGQLQQLQAETVRLCSENAVLTKANKKLNHDVVVLRLGNQGARQIAGPKKSPENPTSSSLEEETVTRGPQHTSGSEAREAVRVAKEHVNQAQQALAEAQRENQTLATRLQTVLMELEKEKQRPTVVNDPSADTIEQGLRKALRDLRSEATSQLEKAAEARRRAVDKLQASLDEAREKEKSTTAAAAEIDRLRAELDHNQEQLENAREQLGSAREQLENTQKQLENTQEQLQTLHQSEEAGKSSLDPESPRSSVRRPRTPRSADPTQAQSSRALEGPAKEEVMASEATPEHVPQALLPVDYGSLVKRAINKGGEGLTELRKEAQDAGMTEGHYDEAQNIFSVVVDSCGEGLASVEQILQGSTVIVDQEASKIQEVLALALERALTSASQLLKEALVGRTRACVAEKRASSEREIADHERAKATALAYDLDKPQQQLAQASTSESEQAALCSKNTRLQEHVAAANSLHHASPMLVDDGATWRRRYEHLAALMVDMTKKSSAKQEDLMSTGSTDVSEGRGSPGINVIEDQTHPPPASRGGSDGGNGNEPQRGEKTNRRKSSSSKRRKFSDRKRVDIKASRDKDKMTAGLAEGANSGRDGQTGEDTLSSPCSGMITPRAVPCRKDRTESESDDLNLDDEERKDSAATNGDNPSRDTGAGGIDEDEVLTKLLDTRTPSVIFKVDHQKLLHQFLKSRDENKTRREVATTTAHSSPPSCPDCILLRKELAHRCAELAAAGEQRLVAQEELEASQHRVYVLSSDIAALQRKLAEHVEVVRRARSFADAVASAPSTDTHQAREALNLKELFDRVTDRSGSGSGSRVPRSTKGNATAAGAATAAALEETRGGRLPGSASSRGDNLQASATPLEVTVGRGLSGNLHDSSGNAASGHGHRLPESNSSRPSEDVSRGGRGDNLRRSREFSATKNQGSLNETREWNKPDPLAMNSSFSKRSINAAEDVSDPTRAAADAATKGETRASPISMEIDENPPSVHGTAASRDTTSAKHVEAGGGNDTRSDGGKGGTASIADSSPSSVQDGAAKSTIAGDVEGDGAIATTEADKGGGQPREPGAIHHAPMSNKAAAASLQEGSTSRQEASGTPRIDESVFVPEERSLVGYCEAAARCKITIEGLEGSCDRLVEIGVKRLGDGLVTDSRDQLRWLTNRYSELTDAMMEWGVEAAAALLVEISRTAAKLGIISGWTTATMAGVKRSREESGKGVVLSEARRDRATLLVAKKAVLREVIENLGGWEAAVFFNSGGVNLDVDVSVWPVEDQLAILSALNDHLRDEMEKRAERHAKALTDLLHRRHESQIENGRLRARLEAEASPCQDTEGGGRSVAWRGDDKGVGSAEVWVPTASAEEKKPAASEEEQRKLQVELTTALASLEVARSDLTKESERRERVERQLRRESQSQAKGGIPRDRQPTVSKQTQTALQEQPRITPQDGVVPRRGGNERIRNDKNVDLVAEADLAERRAQEEEDARQRTGYPLAALAAERRAICELRKALTKALCAVLEICRPIAESSAAAPDKRSSKIEDWLLATPVGDTSPLPPDGGATGPPSTLVQMVYSGEGANVCCAADAYKLCTGMAGRTPTADLRHEAIRHHYGSLSTSSSISRPTLLSSGKTAPHQGIADANVGASARASECREAACVVPSLPPADPREALFAARVAASAIPLFSADVCNVDARGVRVSPRDDDSKSRWDCRTDDNKGLRGTNGTIGGASSRAVAGVFAGGDNTEDVDTTATAKIVHALRTDVLWARAMPSFVQKKLEAQAGRIGQQASITEREIELLAEAQGELRRELRTIKADYVSADADDVIRALRKRVRGLNDNVGSLERQIQIAQESCDVEGGAIEVLEDLLRQRDVDKKLSHGLGMRSLEIGLKIRLLEADAGGKTVKVIRLSQHEQRAVAHLKERLIKERETLNIRKRTVEAQLQRSLPHCMRAFERVSRAIQRLCDGYSSLPGLLEWGRLTAARLQASDRDFNGRGASYYGGDFDDTDGLQASVDFDGGRAKSFPRTGATTAGPRKGERHVAWTRRNRSEEQAPEQHQATAEGSPSLPDRNKGPLEVQAREQVASRTLRARFLKTYLKKCRSNGGGVLSAVQHGQPVPGSAWKADKSTAKTVDNRHNDLSSVSSNNSLARLLREEKAFRQRTTTLHGGPDKKVYVKESASMRSIHNVPALVPLNNVGMPVRFRQQPRRTQALQATR